MTHANVLRSYWISTKTSMCLGKEGDTGCMTGCCCNSKEPVCKKITKGNKDPDCLLAKRGIGQGDNP